MAYNFLAVSAVFQNGMAAVAAFFRSPPRSRQKDRLFEKLLTSLLAGKSKENITSKAAEAQGMMAGIVTASRWRCLCRLFVSAAADISSA
jgi:hypothetical protein